MRDGRVPRLLVAVALLSASAPPLRAQSAEGLRVGATASPPAPRQSAARADSLTPQPPITPRRAFLTSLVMPGVGQAALNRPYAGGVFLLVEALSLTMLHRSAEDLRLARRFSRDSMPSAYQTDPVTGVVARDSLGNAIVTEWQRSRYSAGWVRTRRLHVEDWVAVLFFNHLFAGADAFVAAQLWDLPEKVSLRPTPFGPALTATLRFGAPPRR
ncbi:MAG: hypothetical protein KF689_07070 [Gemmatimonadaceae bacterium]|nr:hypothetical protein [Gemmatimonadaceae bacterium]MCW5825069.1 hypothetical protein [Gemmatimonadaceae bacterium]